MPTFPDPSLTAPAARERAIIEESRRLIFGFFWTVKIQQVLDARGLPISVYKIWVVRDGKEVVGFDLPGHLDPALVEHMVECHNRCVDLYKIASIPGGSPSEALKQLLASKPVPAPQAASTGPEATPEEKRDAALLDTKGLWRG